MRFICSRISAVKFRSTVSQRPRLSYCIVCTSLAVLLISQSANDAQVGLTVGLVSHWPCVTDFVVYRTTGSVVCYGDEHRLQSSLDLPPLSCTCSKYVSRLSHFSACPRVWNCIHGVARSSSPGGNLSGRPQLGYSLHGRCSTLRRYI